MNTRKKRQLVELLKEYKRSQRLNQANNFKEMKRIMKGQGFVESWIWKKYGSKIQKAVNNISKDVGLDGYYDMQDLYLHVVAGDKLKNPAIVKSKYFKDYVNIIDQINDETDAF